MRDIAAAADAHPGLVRYHFGSKAGPYEVIVEEALQGMRDRIGAALGGADIPRDGARRALAAYLDHLEADPDFPKLVLRGVLDEDPVVLHIVSTHLRPLFQGLEPLVSQLPEGPLVLDHTDFDGLATSGCE